MSEKTNIIICAANAVRDRILEQIIENKKFGDIEDEGLYRHGFARGFEEGISFMLGFQKHENQMYRSLAGKVDLAKDGDKDRHAGVVITAVQKAPGKKETEKLYEDVKNYIATAPSEPAEVVKKFAEEHTTESEPEEPSQDDSAVPVTMDACIKATPEQCQACDSNADCPRSCADIEKNNTPELKYAGNPIEKIGNVLANLGIMCIHEGDEHLHYIRFSRSFVDYTVYFQKEDDGNYKVVFSKNDEHGGEVLWSDIISNILIQMKLEYSIIEHVKDW